MEKALGHKLSPELIREIEKEYGVSDRAYGQPSGERIEYRSNVLDWPEIDAT
jgi:hypothetical protein